MYTTGTSYDVVDDDDDDYNDDVDDDENGEERATKRNLLNHARGLYCLLSAHQIITHSM